MRVEDFVVILENGGFLKAKSISKDDQFRELNFLPECELAEDEHDARTDFVVLVLDLRRIQCTDILL